MDKPNSHYCSAYGKSYRKQDYDVCPHCCGNGGGLTKPTWKPNKRQKKEYAKKHKHLLN